MDVFQTRNYAESHNPCEDCKPDKGFICPCRKKEFYNSVVKICDSILEEERSTECSD